MNCNMEDGQLLGKRRISKGCNLKLNLAVNVSKHMFNAKFSILFGFK